MNHKTVARVLEHLMMHTWLGDATCWVLFSVISIWVLPKCFSVKLWGWFPDKSINDIFGSFLG